jgi:hypothetical protein
VAVDPSAAKALFDDEVGTMRSRASFKNGSWTIVSAEFPDLVLELPHPSGARRRFRFRCDDWDDQPPSVKSVDADGTELPEQPTGGKWARLSTGWGLCAQWTREYHGHHSEDAWDSHRRNVPLARIIASVATHYRQATP